MLNTLIVVKDTKAILWNLDVIFEENISGDTSHSIASEQIVPAGTMP